MKFTVVMPDGTTYTERQDIGDGDGGVLDFLAQYPKYQDILPLLQQSTPPQNDYMLLSRLKADCDYFLGAGGRAEKHLWAGNVREQIAKMRELYNALPENRNGSHRRTSNATPSVWSRLMRWWCTTTLKWL